jgi:rRNA-processing protein FCF1
MVRLQIDLVQGMMDCLYAECIPCITQCVMAELEKLGQHYRVALKVAKVWLLVLGSLQWLIVSTMVDASVVILVAALESHHTARIAMDLRHRWAAFSSVTIVS